ARLPRHRVQARAHVRHPDYAWRDGERRARRHVGRGVRAGRRHLGRGLGAAPSAHARGRGQDRAGAATAADPGPVYGADLRAHRRDQAGMLTSRPLERLRLLGTPTRLLARRARAVRAEGPPLVVIPSLLGTRLRAPGGRAAWGTLGRLYVGRLPGDAPL